jgi:hypothetical protein
LLISYPVLAFFGTSMEASFLAGHLCSSSPYKGKKSGAFQEKWLAAYKRKRRGQRINVLRGFAAL